ncbi:MAG: SDR family oxidoreductase [Phycicoccus sp.]
MGLLAEARSDGERATVDAAVARWVDMVREDVGMGRSRGGAMTRVVVLGGTGEMGSMVLPLLRERGHEAVAASRSSGADAATGAGLDDALAGAHTVVDCLGPPPGSMRAAQRFFADAAANVARSAAGAGVRHVVCLSIVGATSPAAQRLGGYYRGKAAQEHTYAAGSVPTTFVRTTQWFTLAGRLLEQFRVGRVALVPRLRTAPVHPEAAAILLAEAVDIGPPHGGSADAEVAGPEVVDAATVARGYARARDLDVRVVGVTLPRPLRDAVLPGPDVPTDPRRFAAWLHDETSPTTG